MPSEAATRIPGVHAMCMSLDTQQNGHRGKSCTQSSQAELPHMPHPRPTKAPTPGPGDCKQTGCGVAMRRASPPQQHSCVSDVSMAHTLTGAMQEQVWELR